jgi:hypothetical protein
MLLRQCLKGLQRECRVSSPSLRDPEQQDGCRVIRNDFQDFDRLLDRLSGIAFKGAGYWALGSGQNVRSRSRYGVGV